MPSSSITINNGHVSSNNGSNSANLAASNAAMAVAAAARLNGIGMLRSTSPQTAALKPVTSADSRLERRLSVSPKPVLTPGLASADRFTEHLLRNQLDATSSASQQQFNFIMNGLTGLSSLSPHQVKYLNQKQGYQIWLISAKEFKLAFFSSNVG